MTKFIDTCALLELQKEAFKSRFYISSITLSELELIKTSSTKDEETKFAARQILHLLKENEGTYEIITYNFQEDEKIISQFGLVQNNDSKIIAGAYRTYRNNKDMVFVTIDLACRAVAKSINLPVESVSNIDKEEYTGYKEVQMNDDELANFYSQVLINAENPYGLKINEYLLIVDNSKVIVDKYRWSGIKYEKVLFHEANSRMFGNVSPLHQDIYQQLALDSLNNNQITVLRGPAGSGKSYLSFGYMFSLLEEHKIDKIIIFCNTVATKGSAKLGFYPGSRTEKLLDSQVGNLLESKLGDRIIVERLISEGSLVLLPMSDIRGYDTSGMNAAIYISEAQNLDIELMRLALQRIGEDSICILDGDFTHQVDMSIYAGSRNGLKRVSEVFRGQDFYGEVELKIIHRSKIAAVAELM